MPKWNGGVIGVANNPTISSAKGIWSLSEATKAIRAGLWPPSNAGADPYFENVTMLLSANGTDGTNNSSFLDSSGNGLHPNRSGNTTQGTFTPFSKPDGRWSNYFDGTGDYLTAGTNSAFAFGTGDFTIECWIYLTGANVNYRGIVSTRSSSGSGNGWVLATDASGNIYIYSNAFLVQASSAIVPNTWYHVAVCRASGTTTLYLNGVSKATSTTARDYTDSGLAISNDPYVSGEVWQGYITGMRLVKGTAVYTSAFTPPTAPPTAITNTSLLTCQSNRFIDNSTNAFAITRNGDVSVQTFSPFPTLTAYAAGTNGGSGYFDGTGDFLSVTNNAAFDFGSGDMTIECWFYITGNAALNNDSVRDACLFSSFPASGTLTTTYDLNVGGNGSTTGTGISFGRRASGTNTTLTYTATITQGSWHHVAVVRTSSTLSLYLDGSRVAQNTSFSGNIDSGGHTIRVGTLGFAGYLNEFPGYISGLRMLKGTAQYSGATYTLPTAPLTAITNTSLLCNFTNGGIIDNAMSNDLETVGGAQISTTQSKFGGASMYFDGNGDYLYVAPSNNLPFLFGSGDFTVEAWIYPSSVSGYQYICSVWGTSGQSDTTYSSWQLRTNSANLETVLQSGSTTTSITGSGTSLSANTWQHVALTRASNTVRLFINGTQVASQAYSSTLNSPASAFVVGLQISNLNPYTGYIDDLRVTKGYARYTANFTAPTAPFVTFGD
jgi:hypothetical protein